MSQNYTGSYTPVGTPNANAGTRSDKPQAGPKAGQSAQQLSKQPRDQQSRSSEAGMSTVVDEADRLWDNAVSTAQSAVAAANRTIQRNPTLAIAGVVAFGAVAALVIRNRRSQTSGNLHALRRNVERQAHELRKVVRNEMRAHNMDSAFNRVAGGLGNLDLRPYIQPLLEPLVERASSLAQSAQKSVSQMTK